MQRTQIKIQKASTYAFYFVVVFFTIWSLLFIFRSSFVIDSQRYFCLFDDAMVSMRYAHNIAMRLGPVWNPGEYVEGYTNPAWMFLMTIPHFLSIPLYGCSLFVQLLSLLCLIVNLFAVRRLATLLCPKQKTVASLLAVFCTALLYPLNYWSLMGMEVGCLTMLTTWALVLALQNKQNGRYSLFPYFLLSVAIWVRPDAIVLFAALFIAMFIIDRPNRLRLTIGCFILLFVFFGTQELWRFRLYHDLLPNTYYLKMQGFPVLLRMSRGFFYTALSFCSFPIIIIFLILFLKWHRLSLSSLFIPPLLLIVFMFLYSTYVGGDAWERRIDLNRFVCIVSPLIVVLMIALVSMTYRFTGLVTVLLILACAIWRSTSPLDILLLRPPVDREDNIRNTSLAIKLMKEITPDKIVAVEYAGTLPYFLSHNKMIDLLGKSDRYVARLPMHRNILQVASWREFYPGHLKWDYAYSIQTLKPDVICAIWKKNAPDAQKYLDQYEEIDMFSTQVYFRKPNKDNLEKR